MEWGDGKLEKWVIALVEIEIKGQIKRRNWVQGSLKIPKIRGSLDIPIYSYIGGGALKETGKTGQMRGKNLC